MDVTPTRTPLLAHHLEPGDVLAVDGKPRQVKTVGLGARVRIWYTDGSYALHGRDDVLERWAS